MQNISLEELDSVCGGFDWNPTKWNWKKIGEYAAPVLAANPITAPVAPQLMNKPAAVQGGIWGLGGAVAGSAAFPEGTILGAAGGALAGYYSSLANRDLPTK